MGCDIHFAVEKKINDIWVPVDEIKADEGEDWLGIEYKKEFYRGRNYRLFSILADVRNGSGLAGYDTGDRITPICEPKGIPEDCSPLVKKMVEQWDCDAHSTSYLTVSELLDYDWTQVATIRGYVGMKEYLRFKLEGSPDSWAGGVGGGSVKILSNEEMDKVVSELEKETDKKGWQLFHEINAGITIGGNYTQVQWETPYYEFAGNFLSKTIFQMLQLGKPDEVRCVFFFDN